MALRYDAAATCSVTPRRGSYPAHAVGRESGRPKAGRTSPTLGDDRDRGDLYGASP